MLIAEVLYLVCGRLPYRLHFGGPCHESCIAMTQDRAAAVAAAELAIRNGWLDVVIYEP